ncbi:hypothetical protein C0W42_21930 [Photobacterium kishitanii]|uniref:M66 family metalloprotease n=1 Tax=Photobacterium kishitanii TaxID=318456 RepID=UPI000D1752EF|nr:M66 family metalloprotease [Photobacterium kishitanii]PSU84697.1 hypothetical protein C0W42_21930 [Photobacterium kishitanii]
MKKVYILSCIQAVLASNVHATQTESIVDESHKKPHSHTAFSQSEQGDYAKLTRSEDNKLYFVSKRKHESNLSGELEGYVSFAQSHTIAPNDNSENELPHLVSKRKTLLMITFPTLYQTDAIISATVMDNNGQVVGELDLQPPSLLPKSDRPSNLDASHPDVIYAENTWSAVIPWDMVTPSMTIQFKDNKDITGVLNNIEVGAENEIVIQNIRIGMLTEPPRIDKFEENPLLAIDYFQKLPISSMKVGNYSPLYLEEVVLPNGTKYTENSAVKGSVYSGDMRENIAKSLISMGIDNANFGINDTAGSAQWQPQYFNQYVVHKVAGRYTNGIVTHGLSGGNGMATLLNTTGNEFSHELGHAYGMGHYPGGGLQSTHNDNSGWGWDSSNNRFIANFFWNLSGITEIQGEITQPFNELYRFNTDAMAGGVSSSPISAYTHHTGYTTKRIQQNFEKTGILTTEGYKKWNATTQKMEANNIGSIPEVYGTDVVTLVGYYDPQMEMSSYIYPALYGSFGHTFEQNSPTAIQCWVNVELSNGNVKRFPLSGQRLNPNEMNKFHVNVTRSDAPTSASVSCPEHNPLNDYHDWLLNKFEVTSFQSWSGSRHGNIGDVYEYHRPGGDTEYFRLNSSTYWYFPSTGDSNGHWEYLGSQNQLNQEFVISLNEILFEEAKAIELNKRVITAPSVEPQPALFIGEEYGYDQVRAIAADKALTFDEIDSLLKSKDFGSINEFLSFIAPHYNQSHVERWNGKRTGEIGDLYYYPNPYTGKQEFFILKTKEYGYFPTNQSSNHQWKYLGLADIYLNETLSPFDINLKKTLKENLARKVNNGKGILYWNQRFIFPDIGLVYKYDNPYNGDQEYFRQVRSKNGWYFPTSKGSNNQWVYLGDEKQFQHRKDKLATFDGFEADILNWYKQNTMAQWGDKAEVGTIFEYKFHDGDIYYFRLNQPSYSYFPWPENGIGYSRGSWEYMGKFDL